MSNDIFGTSTPAMSGQGAGGNVTMDDFTPELQSSSVSGQGEGVQTEGVTNPPSTTDDGKQGTQVENTQQTEQTQTDDWRGRFQSPEEMYKALLNSEKSYSHLRPKLSAVTDELSQLRKSAQDVTKTVEEVGQGHRGEQGEQSDPMQAVAQVMQRMIEPIRQKQAQTDMQNLIAQIAFENKDSFDKIAPELQGVLKEDPNLWMLGQDKAVRYAYEIAKSRYIAKESSQAVESARQDAYADKEIKVINSSAPKSVQNLGNATYEEDIAQSIINASKGRSIFL